jgi:CDP-glucose 4,6-dehydratase
VDEWGSGSWTTPADAGRQPHEAHHLSLDSTKAREQLEWAPVWDPQTAVRRTAAWYRDYYRAPGTAPELVRHQLQAFESDARIAGLPWAVDETGQTA